MSRSMTPQQPWPWPERMDALHAAPASHRILLDHDRVRVRWMEPEGPHSVENIDERRYHAIRVELKIR
jgi:hypothetical protein